MGRIFEVPWGGVREMAEELLRAAAPIALQQGRRIDVLVPRAAICPVRHPAIREVVLPRFASNRILWDHWTVANHANASRNAILYNVKLVLPERLRIPGFTTLHDLMYFPQPAKYNWREYLLGDTLYMRLMVRRTVHRARYTHTVSEYTARDARDLFPGIPPDRFVAIPHGMNAEKWSVTDEDSDDRIWRDLEQRGVRPPYIFYSGGLSRRKNVRVLAQAFQKFHRRHPDFHLVLTGGSKPTLPDPLLRRALNRIPSPACIRLGEVSFHELRLLYQRARFFVFPSLYEGFGLPVLEAQAARCPVIAARATSLPEVARDSAAFFDPHSPAELLDRMEQFTDPANRERFRALGLDNLHRFRWEETARRWLQLADRIFREHGR